ncbi:hypothetical protein, partial [Escherichia coli]|uniref:hypothetical protein n=1 Tax=Escherichia coli TaxID=562 RepID=UPI001BC82D0D
MCIRGSFNAVSIKKMMIVVVFCSTSLYGGISLQKNRVTSVLRFMWRDVNGRRAEKYEVKY